MPRMRFIKVQGGVSAYDLEDRFCPKLINSILSGTAGPCHVSLAMVNGSDYLLSAGYFDGRVCMYPISADGSVMECKSMIQHHGSGPFVDQHGECPQNQARAHYVIQVPGTDYILCADLGSDRIYTYTLTSEKLVETSVCSINPGYGPRHFVMHPSGETLYLITELNSAIVVLDFDKKTGKLQTREYIPTLPENYNNESFCAAIRLSKDNRFLYGSNRGHNSIVTYLVEDDGKRLVKSGYLSEMISWPRDFEIDPSGKYMIVANQDTHTLSLNRICDKTGIPEFTGKTVHVKDPASIVFCT